MTNAIPAQTIKTVARSVFREASSYGFGPVDIVRLINELMDLCKESSDAEPAGATAAGTAEAEFTGDDLRLPLVGKHIVIRGFRD